MNTPLTDDELGDRVRAALDELANTVDGDDGTAPPALSPSPTGRRLAMAAAAVLVVGAVAAIGVNLAGRDTGSQGDGTPDTAAPPASDTAGPEPTATTPGSPAAWVVLASQDLVPGEVNAESCCIPFPAPGPATVTAWASVDGLDDGLLLLTAEPSLDGTEPEQSWASNGFSQERMRALIQQVVPGSGLPYVLPDPSVTLLDSGLDGAGNLTTQTYRNDRGTVTVTVGDYRGQLTPLVEYGFHDVDLPGFGVTGYRATVEGGGEYVVWQMPNGQWATLEVPPALADRTDGLVAALAPVASPPVAVGAEETSSTTSTVPVVGPDGEKAATVIPVDQITGEALPLYTPESNDPAVGMPAPQFGGVVIDPASPTRTLVVFTARWCPHCKAEMPRLLALETPGVPGSIAPPVDGAPGTNVVLVDTASLAVDTNGNAISNGYEMSDYERWGHTGTVYTDRDPGDGSPGELATAYGVTGYPFLVLVDVDGTILRRAMGEMDESDRLAFING